VSRVGKVVDVESLRRIMRAPFDTWSENLEGHAGGGESTRCQIKPVRIWRIYLAGFYGISQELADEHSSDSGRPKPFCRWPTTTCPGLGGYLDLAGIKPQDHSVRSAD